MVSILFTSRLRKHYSNKQNRFLELEQARGKTQTKETQTDRQTDRQTNRDRDRNRDTERETERDTDR